MASPRPIDRIVGGEAGGDDEHSPFFGDEREQARFLRRLRKASRRAPACSPSEELLEGAVRVDTEYDSFPFSIDKLEPLAQESVTAWGLLESALYAARGLEALEAKDFRMAARAFGKAYRKNSMVVRWNMSDIPIALDAFKNLSKDRLETNAVRADAIVVRSHLLFFQGQTQEPRSTSADCISTHSCSSRC